MKGMIDMITGYDREHLTIYLEKSKTWVYADNQDKVDDNNPRPCFNCGKLSTPEGYDACLGHIEGAIHACCNHGMGNGYKILEDGTKVEL